MILAALMAIKGVLFGAVTFVFERWRVFLPLAIVAAIGLYIYQLQGQRDQYRDSLAALSKYIADETEKRQVENNTKDAIAKATLATVATKHSDEIKKWRSDYEALQKQYGTNKTALLAATASNVLWRERVRLETEANTERLRTLSVSGRESTEGGGDSDTTIIRRAYDNLELACKITTSDYNALRLSWDSACLIYGCKP